MWTHEVKTTIIGDESSDLLSVLDELDTDTLSDSRVGLLGLDTDLDSQYRPCVSSVVQFLLFLQVLGQCRIILHCPQIPKFPLVLISPIRNTT
jgi:hypothetical protein